MCIARLPGGGLFVHNAVMVDDATRAAIDALGPVEFIFVPNKFHDMDGGKMKALYPAAKLVALEATRALKAKKFPDIEVLDPGKLPDSVRVEKIPGLKHDECVMEVHSRSGFTLVLTDALFNLAPMPGFTGLMLKVFGSIGPLKLTKIGRLGLLGDAKQFRDYLTQTAERTDVKRILVSHGEPVERDIAAALRAAAAGV